MKGIKEKDAKYIAGTYARFPIAIKYGKGSVLYDENGKSYIDMGSGIAVNIFGLQDDVWKEAVIEQMNKYQHTSNLYYTEPCVKLAELLCEKTGMKKVFFSNSGAEANECAIKVIRKYQEDKKSGKYNIITLKNSFHGRTLATLAATAQDEFHKNFLPFTPGFVAVEAGNLEALKKAVKDHNAAGILFETIQGEGGVNPLSYEYVKGIEKIAHENDMVIAVDEVQTGNGRTGELYSYMGYGITPDIVTTAKGIGGGLPIGITMMGEKTEGVLTKGTHGSTFGGNPIAAAGAYSILTRINQGLLEGIKQKSEYIFEILQGKKGIKSVTGKGLMIGIETERKADNIVNDCIEKGVLVLKAKNKIRLLPALNIGRTELIKAMDIIIECIAIEDKEENN